MSMTDPIADMLTRIRNANTAEHEYVDIPKSKLKEEIARILKEEGYIKGFNTIDGGSYDNLRVYLKYGPEGQKVITGMKRISKPSIRVYARKDEVPKVLGGLGIAVISTSQGLMTDRNAREAGVGGEVLCYVW